MDEKKSLEKVLEEKIKWGHQMVGELKDAEKVDGIDKLIRKIQQEIKFLNKVQSTGTVKKEHLKSTNLVHLDAIVKRLLTSKDPVGVLKPFKYENSKLEVDIVCDNGSSWVKVIARNPKALTLISCGNAEYGQKSIIDQAETYKRCAKNHPYMYKPPNIIFHFANGVEKFLSHKLNVLGVEIEGSISETDSYPEEEDFSDSESDLEESDVIAKCSTDLECFKVETLNLDVSTLLAYVTNVTNGSAHYVFAEPLLTEQAKWDRERPVKPVLDNLFKNRKLVVCQTAFTSFKNIVDLIGGANEKKRADEFLSRVDIVDDVPVGRIMNLNIGGKVKPRSRIVFATGENLKSVTVSSNEGFVRAARMQGIECMVFIHEPRSLSEMKQRNARVIE